MGMIVQVQDENCTSHEAVYKGKDGGMCFVTVQSSPFANLYSYKKILVLIFTFAQTYY